MNHYRRPTADEIASEAVRRAAFDREASDTEPATACLTFDDDDWLENDIPARPWIAKGYLLRRSVTAIVGAGAAGKSSLMVAWAISLALCEQFHRFRPQQACRVLTFNTEDDRDEQRRRFSAALRHAGRQPADISGKVVRAGTRGVGTLFGKLENGTIGALPAMGELRTRLEAFRPDVLILDPLVELHNVEENDNSDMREVLARLRGLAVEFNMAVVVAHHTRKGTVAPGDPDVARGASAVKDLARVTMTLTVMQEEDAKALNIRGEDRHLYFRLDDAKQNYGPMGEAEWFERVVYPLENGDFVATAAPWNVPTDLITPDKRAAIAAGLALGSSEGPYSPKLDKSARSFRRLCLENDIVTQEGQRRLLDEMLATGGCHVQSFKKASNRATAQGIRCADGRPMTANWTADLLDEDT